MIKFFFSFSAKKTHLDFSFFISKIKPYITWYVTRTIDSNLSTPEENRDRWQCMEVMVLNVYDWVMQIKI